jgi:hypothetical protein
MVLTDTEDHDIAPNNDGLAAERRKVSTVTRACQSRRETRSAPAQAQTRSSRAVAGTGRHG